MSDMAIAEGSREETARCDIDEAVKCLSPGSGSYFIALHFPSDCLQRKCPDCRGSQIPVCRGCGFAIFRSWNACAIGTKAGSK